MVTSCPFNISFLVPRKQSILSCRPTCCRIPGTWRKQHYRGKLPRFSTKTSLWWTSTPHYSTSQCNNNIRDISNDYLLTYLLTYSMEQSHSWESISFAARQEFPPFYGTRSFITAFTSACHLFLSWPSSIQSIPPHSTSWRSILILSTQLRLGLPSGLFPSGFPTRNLCTPLFFPKRATCPAHLILLDYITRTILGEEYKSLSSSLCSFLHSPVISSLLGPIFSSTSYSQTPSA